jgi:hypothetical protein
LAGAAGAGGRPAPGADVSVAAAQQGQASGIGSGGDDAWREVEDMSERKGVGRQRKERVGKKEKERAQLPNERMRVMPHQPCPCTFVGQAMSLMNISNVYSSVTWPDRQMYVAVPC